jgi:hypothetical protein
MLTHNPSDAMMYMLRCCKDSTQTPTRKKEKEKKKKRKQALCRYTLDETCFPKPEFQIRSKSDEKKGKMWKPSKPHPNTHCVKNNFFFLTIFSKHICTTPFDCFDLEW